MRYPLRRIFLRPAARHCAVAALAGMIAAAAAAPAFAAGAGGLDIFYAQNRYVPQTPGLWPGLDILYPQYAQSQAGVRTAAAAGPVVTPVPYDSNTCRSGIWQRSDGSEVSGIACLQPDGAWHIVQ